VVVYGKRRAIVGVALLAACARSGIELAASEDGTGDGDGAGVGGRGGSAATGGDGAIGGTTAGASPATGGMGLGGSRPYGGRGQGANAGTGGEGPIEPGGPIPNCAVESPVFVPPKDRRYIYLEAWRGTPESEGRYVLELAPNSLRVVSILSGPQGGFHGWSADGGFLAFSRASPDGVIELYGTSPYGPVTVPPRSGTLTWSHSDGRYALKTNRTATTVSELVIVDATTRTERVIALPDTELSFQGWSPDDRYVALAGTGGLILVDTLGAELSLVTVRAGRVTDVYWSADGRYVSFELFDSVEGRRSLMAFDTRSAILEILDEDSVNIGLTHQWTGNTSLVMTIDEDETFYIDLGQRPHPRIPFASGHRGWGAGSVSPGAKCYAYFGRCEAARETGICVKTLPPDREKPSVLVHRASDGAWLKRFAGTGDQLLLESSYEPWLINVELDGGDFTRQLVTEGTMTNNVGNSFGWNPNGRSDWIGYSLDPTQELTTRGHPRFWHRPTGQSFDVDTGAGPVEGWAWSRDGKYLFVKSADEQLVSDYYLQEVRDGELGGIWRVQEIRPAEESRLRAVYLQP
jgi:hypothetical protein